MKQIIKIIDTFLNSITMYRLVLYSLIILSVQALVFSFLGILSFTPISLLLSAAILLGACYLTNEIFARILKVPTNVESVFITALILFLIFSPATQLSEVSILMAAGVISMASKYILAFQRKHIFNPAALAAVVLGFFTTGAIWWVGSAVMLPTTLILGILIVRKIRRFHLLLAFLLIAIVTILAFGVQAGLNLSNLLSQVLTSWPLFFFGTIMLTEPLTTPPTRRLRIIYGILVGMLFGAQFHIGPVYATPELALIIGNIFAYIVSSKQKLLLQLQEKIKLAPDIYEFVFSTNQQPRFVAGQYLEWTVPHSHPDSRGNRRYFTIASAPTEKEIKLGIKMPAEASSFKRTLMDMKKNDPLLAGQLAGDFTLPKDVHQKLVFIAGGIGITPFRSMIQYLVDTKEKREITLLYASASPADFVYQEVFSRAENKINLKPVYIITKKENVPEKWTGQVGRISAEMIEAEVPDYQQRMFYVSGPNAMVEAYKDLLHILAVPANKIVVDYFPGF